MDGGRIQKPNRGLWGGLRSWAARNYFYFPGTPKPRKRKEMGFPEPRSQGLRVGSVYLELQSWRKSCLIELKHGQNFKCSPRSGWWKGRDGGGDGQNTPTSFPPCYLTSYWYFPWTKPIWKPGNTGTWKKQPIGSPCPTFPP